MKPSLLKQRFSFNVTRTKRRHVNLRRSQQGLSLVELMISITIGSILMAGLIEIFISNKQAYRLKDNLNILQENGRFAMEAISESIRMTDHWGGVEGEDVTDTTGSTITGIGSCNHAWLTDTTIGITGHDGASTIAGVGLPTGCIVNADYVPNTDVVVLRYASSSRAVATADLTNTSNPNNNDTVFVRSAVGGTGVLILGSDGTPGTHPDQDGTYNFPYAVEVYYIRACSQKVSSTCSDTIPTLTRLTLTTDITNPPGLVEEPVAENIEQFQVQYGRDTDNDGDVDRYDNATALTAADWGNVVNIKLSLIARSATKDTAFTDSSSYTLQDYTYTPATANQNYQRKQYDRIIQIRNRNRI